MVSPGSRISNPDHARGVQPELLHSLALDAQDDLLAAVAERAVVAQLIDEIDSGRYPGLFLLITGTPAFYDGSSGVSRLAPLAPLAQRLSTDFSTHPRYDNPRAVQIRLPGFDRSALAELGNKVRDLYAAGSDVPDRIADRADDAYIADLAGAVTGALGGKVGVAPRVFLKKLVADVLDRVDQFEDFDPGGITR